MSTERSLNYYWRLAGTGASFVIFGVGGLVLGLGAVPLLHLLERNPVRRARTVRHLIHLSFRGFIGMMRVLRVLTYEVDGADTLREAGLLLVANHPTLLDVVFLVSLATDAVCVVKQGLFNNPWMGFVIRSAGYVSNRDPQASIDDSVAALGRGSSIIIFPEGTRTTQGAIVRLQRGAAYIAVDAGCPITPVSIRCEPPSLSKEERWYEIPHCAMHYIIRVERDLAVVRTDPPGDSRTRVARRVTEMIQHTLFGSTTDERS